MLVVSLLLAVTEPRRGQTGDPRGRAARQPRRALGTEGRRSLDRTMSELRQQLPGSKIATGDTPVGDTPTDQSSNQPSMGGAPTDTVAEQRGDVCEPIRSY